jgi:MoaA/NifB/PqqE/SkfB family radical SAM enzyme
MNWIRPQGYIIYTPTYHCNYKCYHCNLENLATNQIELDASEIYEVFENSKTLNKLPIDISGGEPFLKEDIIEIIKNLTKLSHPVGITTNGSFPEKIRKLIKEVENTDLISFGVSIDGFEKIHDKIRGINSFKKAVESLKIIKENDIKMSINTTISELNINYIEQIKQFFEDFHIHHNFTLQSMVMTTNNYYDFNIKNLAPFLNKADLKFAFSGGRFRINDCYAGYAGCLINPSGVVYTCLTRGAYYHSNKFIMGDLRKYDLNFDTLWVSPGANEARQSVKSCVGCYGPCEINREIRCHTIDLSFSREELSKLDLPNSITMGENDYIFIENDWHSLENWPPKIRWTGKYATAYLKADNYRDKLFIKAFNSFPCIKGQILIDKKQVQRFEILECEWKLLEVALPAFCKNKIIEVTIEIEKTWIPDKIINNGDTRELGIAVEKIWME